MCTAQCWDLSASHGLMPKQSVRIVPGGVAGNSAQGQVSAGGWSRSLLGWLGGVLLMAWLILGIPQTAGESDVKLSSASLA